MRENLSNLLSLRIKKRSSTLRLWCVERDKEGKKSSATNHNNIDFIFSWRSWASFGAYQESRLMTHLGEVTEVFCWKGRLLQTLPSKLRVPIERVLKKRNKSWMGIITSFHSSVYVDTRVKIIITCDRELWGRNSREMQHKQTSWYRGALCFAHTHIE